MALTGSKKRKNRTTAASGEEKRYEGEAAFTVDEKQEDDKCNRDIENDTDDATHDSSNN